ncbi:MAG TPA: hypothetical protein VF711_08670 [Acidimicrobiales bacterium]|jgi:hypothetical protein
MTTGDGSKAPAQLVLLRRSGTRTQSLDGAVLADNSTGTAFGDPETFTQDHNGPATTLRGQKFPVMMIGC